jgi:putative protease
VNFGDVKNLLATPNHPDIYLRVSNILRQELQGVLSRVKALDGLSGLVTNNVGVIRQMAKTHRIIGDYKLNIFNSDALKLYGEDLALAMVSEELNRKDLAERKNKAHLMTVVYGRQELMHSEYCPVGSTVGGMTKSTPCNEACMRQHYALKDRMDEVFPVMTDVFCRSYIMNGKPKNLLDTVKDLTYLGIRSHRIDLTVETPEESRKVIQAFLREEPLPLESFNRGHYKRGVE